MTWRIAWHDGFGGTVTTETDHPAELVEQLREQHVDWIEIFGAY